MRHARGPSSGRRNSLKGTPPPIAPPESTRQRRAALRRNRPSRRSHHIAPRSQGTSRRRETARPTASPLEAHWRAAPTHRSATRLSRPAAQLLQRGRQVAAHGGPVFAHRGLPVSRPGRQEIIDLEPAGLGRTRSREARANTAHGRSSRSNHGIEIQVLCHMKHVATRTQKTRHPRRVFRVHRHHPAVARRAAIHTRPAVPVTARSSGWPASPRRARASTAASRSCRPWRTAHPPRAPARG